MPAAGIPSEERYDIKEGTEETLTRDEAAGQLWRMAQAQTMIEDIDFPVGSDGKVIPTRKALDMTNRENPKLVRLAYQK